MVTGSPATHLPRRLPEWGPLLRGRGGAQGHTQEETTEETHQVQEEAGRSKAERGTDIPVWGGRVWHRKCRDRDRWIVSRGRVVHGLWLVWAWNKFDLSYLLCSILMKCTAGCYWKCCCMLKVVCMISTYCLYRQSVEISRCWRQLPCSFGIVPLYVQSPSSRVLSIIYPVNIYGDVFIM